MNRIKQKLLSLLALLIMSVSLFAQGTVTGVLVDAVTKEPLAWASVYLEKNVRTGTLTDIDGTFELVVPEGEHKVVYKYLGYINKTASISITGNKNLGTIALEPSTVGINEVSVVASFATDRKTPVAMSNIPAAVIQEKLGNQEFPEVLKSTPSVYATKGSGGFGDSRVNIRGFNTSNIGVLVNGVPVNDMENGKVYFSNWAGLNDVTSVMQVQRGLGASKLAISSVGGTMNILTKSADANEGGSFYAGMGNDGYRKANFNVSTGLMDNGWAITLLGGIVKGDGYIDGTSFEGYNYFANITKVINDKHRLSFQVFGAPQTHGQRGNKHLISTFENKNESLPFSNTSGAKYNSEWGIRNGEAYGGGYGYNFYHKPQASINHHWDINGTTTLSTSAYASVSTGGGRRLRGDKASEVEINRTSFSIDNMNWRTGDGIIDWDKMIDHNKNINGEADFVIGNSINSHEWYGLLSTLNTVKDNVNLTFGLDSRYYKGSHYEQLDDLLGGQFYTDDRSVNRPNNTPLREGDIYSFHNDMQVVRNGLFGQAEFVLDQWSAFVSAASSYQNVRRIDYLQYTPGDQVSDWANFLDWSVKGGVNYNINDHHNVFVNGGYFIRSPFVKYVFDGYTNNILDDAKYEKVLTFEAGYGYKTRTLNLKLGYYRTEWRDQGLSKFIVDQSYNILGLNSLHQGLEFEGSYKPVKNLTIRGMASVGDWKYTDDVRFQQFDDQNNLVGEFNAYIQDVSVGNSAQITAALGVDYRFFNGFNIGVDGNYFGRNFADFDPSTRTGESSKGVDAWQIPDSYLIDMNAGYNFNISSLSARISGRINNLLNTVYITDAQDGQDHNWQTSPVYYGFGRTFSLGLKVNF